MSTVGVFFKSWLVLCIFMTIYGFIWGTFNAIKNSKINQYKVLNKREIVVAIGAIIVAGPITGVTFVIMSHTVPILYLYFLLSEYFTKKC